MEWDLVNRATLLACSNSACGRSAQYDRLKRVNQQAVASCHEMYFHRSSSLGVVLLPASPFSLGGAGVCSGDFDFSESAVSESSG